MPRESMARRAAWILAILLLLNTGALGVYNGITELTEPAGKTPLQQSVTIGVVVYGILGLAAAVALIARKRSAVWLTLAWTAVVTYVASTAALAYAGDATVGGAIAAGSGAALTGLLVVWCARVATRTGAKVHGLVHAEPR